MANLGRPRVRDIEREPAYPEIGLAYILVRPRKTCRF